MSKSNISALTTNVQPHQKTQKQPPYNVILLDDNDHTFDYVISMLQRLFGHPQEKGLQIAQTVHHQGRAIVLTTTFEHAELKRDQVRTFGPDELISGCKGSMSAIIEPVGQK